MSIAPEAVCVQTGARLHFGLLSQGAQRGRRYGGLGVMIAEPGWTIWLAPARVDTVVAPVEWQPRIATLLTRIRQLQPVSLPVTRVAVEVLKAPPSHAGFGSGTQLGLAVAWGLSQLAHEVTPDVRELARRAGRGLRSALGIHGFAWGGLLLEAGQAPEGGLGPLVARVDTPAEWRMLLLQRTSELDGVGLAGDAEVQALASLPAMTSELTDRLCGLAVRQVFPAALEGRLEEFAEGLWEYGCLVGDYFAPAQGGRFADPRLAEIVPLVRARGYSGVVQTSWGPTLAVVCGSEEAGSELMSYLSRKAPDLETRLVAPLNSGVATPGASGR